MRHKHFETKINNINTCSIRITFGIFIVVAALFAILISFAITYHSKSTIAEIKKNEETVTKQYVNEINRTFIEASDDIRHIASDRNLTDYLETGNNNYKDTFAAELIRIAAIKNNFYKLRYIDETGKEKLRVNRQFEKPYSVTEYYLQTKFNRYFFKEAVHTPENSIYISPMDLNVENGIIDVPLKPTIRFCVNLFDSKNDNKGIFAINYSLYDLFSRITKDSKASNGIPMLVNSDGYWLLGNSENEWGFMLDERKNMKFPARYAQEWQEITSAEDGQTETENGLFTYKTIHIMNNIEDSIPTANNNIRIFIVQQITPETLKNLKKSKAYDMALMVMLIIIASTIPAWLISEQYAKRRLRENIKKIGEGFDIGTELPGKMSFFETLSDTVEDAAKQNASCGLILIELSNWKDIMQQHGIETTANIWADIADAAGDCENINCFIAQTCGNTTGVIVRQTEDKAELQAVADNILNCVSSALRDRYLDISAELSAGVCIYPEEAYKFTDMYTTAMSFLINKQKSA